MKAMFWLFVLSFALLIALAGCAETPAPTPIKVTVDNFCRITRSLSMSWSVHDTTETIDSMRKIAHVRTCTCAKHKPKSCYSGGTA